MCGILGLVTTRNHRLLTPDPEITRLRDLMTHRGPDGSGLWRAPHAALAHRRLAVLDPSPAGAQPIATPDGRFVLIYNGELYNDAELRARAPEYPFRTSCDTETVLAWLSRRWGDALADLRGMYALALLDTHAHRLLLARDPLAIKPLYWWAGEQPDASPLLLFASEIPPLLAHPALTPEPDFAVVSAYLTTLRPTLAERTLYRGIRTLPPGGVLEVDLAGPALRLRRGRIDIQPDPSLASATPELVRDVVERSVRAHLRADVPMCSLLSGGLDSAIIAATASRELTSLVTYWSGADADPSPDRAPARAVAATLATDHREAPVSRELFARRWPELVRARALPLTTPNEIAIHEVARHLRTQGHVVALSGEGADETFAGYDRVLAAAASHIAQGNPDPWLFQLSIAAWCPIDAKPRLLTPDFWSGVEHDDALLAWARELWDDIAPREPDPLAAHLRFQRRAHLPGLLARLDSSTMLASVEGRTPFTDVEVVRLAESLPIARRFQTPDRTKLALREAFADRIPADALTRPKASFPLPFESWVADAAPAIAASTWLRELILPDALNAIARDPASHWRLAWPLANLALWSGDLSRARAA